VEPVHILFGCDRTNHFVCVNLCRKRKLHQNSVYRSITIQLLHKRKKFFLRRLLRQFIGQGTDADIGAGFLFVIDIHAGSRIGSYLDHCKHRFFSKLFLFRNLLAQFVLDLL